MAPSSARVRRVGSLPSGPVGSVRVGGAGRARGGGDGPFGSSATFTGSPWFMEIATETPTTVETAATPMAALSGTLEVTPSRTRPAAVARKPALTAAPPEAR